MSFHINSDKEKIRGVNPKLIGDNEATIRVGSGADEQEIMRLQKDPNSGLPRVGINRTGQRIDKITLDQGGTGYTQVPLVVIDAPPAGGTQAQASATIFNGRVTTVVVNDPGNGYTTAPNVSFTGGNGTGAAATASLDTVEFELDINGAIRTSTSIISDTARILNIDVENFVTPDLNLRSPNLKTFMNGTGTPWAANVIVQKDQYRYAVGNVYQATNTGTTGTLEPEHKDGIVANGDVLFKHIGFRVSNQDDFNYLETGEAGTFPRSITPLLGDRSDKIATTEYVLNLATNDVGGRVYVSQQIGSDLNDGRSAVNPVRSIKKAAQIAWSTPGVKETIIVSGGDYVEDNPISLPPDCSVVGDNLRLVIIRPGNIGKHLFKFGDKNYVTGVTYRDKVDSNGDPVGTWDYAMVFDDKQRIIIDQDVNGDASVDFPIGHQIFGPDQFRIGFQNNTGLSLLATGAQILGLNTGARANVFDVTFASTTGANAYISGTIDVSLTAGSFIEGDQYSYITSAAAGGALSQTISQTAGENVLRFTTDPSTDLPVGNVVQLNDADNSSFAGTGFYQVSVINNGNAPTYWDVTFVPILGANGWDTTQAETISINSATPTTNTIDTINLKSIRAEGEVVDYSNDIVSTLPITRIDFSLQGDASIATGGFQQAQFGSAEDIGGIVFYTSALVGRTNFHEFKEGEEIVLENMPTSNPDLSFLNGKQRIYKVLEDADGRARRFVIPKKIPSLTTANYQPSEFAVVKSYSKVVTLSLLNSPNKFPISTPVDRRFQDAALLIRNNREYIAEEVLGRINKEFSKDYFAVYNLNSTDNKFDIYLGPTDHVNTYVSGGTVTFGGSSYAISGFAYDNVGGVATITTTAAAISALSEDAIVKLADILISCDAGQKIYPSYSAPTSGSNTGTDGDTQCKQDVIHFLNALVRDLEFGTNFNIITGAKKYIVDGKITYIDDEIIENVRAIEYARELATYAMCNWRIKDRTVSDPLYVTKYATSPRYTDTSIINTTAGSPACANVATAIDTLSYLWVDVISNNANGTYLDAAYLIARNADLIADQALIDTEAAYPTLDLSDIHQRKCRRDIKIVLEGLIRDLVLGGNHGIVSTAEAYFSGTVLSGISEAQRAETLYAFERVKIYSIQAMRNWSDGNVLLSTPTGSTYVPATGALTVVIPDPAVAPVANSDRIAFSEGALTFSCAHGGGGTDAGPYRTDIAFGKSFLITNVVSSGGSTTISCNVGAAGSNNDAHTFDSALANGTKIIYGPVELTSPIPKYEDWSILTGGGAAPIGIFTPTTATYDPANGDLTFTTATAHNLTTSNTIRFQPESLVFTCDMDNDATEHRYPQDGQPAFGNNLVITGTTSNTVTVNVGTAGTDVQFTPTAGSYDPATGIMTLEIGNHTLDVGEGVVIADNSLTFTCLMDGNQSPKTYPRPSIDRVSGRSIPIAGKTATTISVNVGKSPVDRLLQATTGTTYDPTTGDLVLQVGQHGIGVGRNIVLEDGAVTFTCLLDGNSTQHSYPRSTDPASGTSLAVTAVGSTSHTVTNAPYDATTGIITFTLSTHNFATGDYIKIDDDALTYTCVLDGNSVNKSYPRAGFDYVSNRWLPITKIDDNTFSVDVGVASSADQYSHTFVSAAANGIKRQDGTLTVNVGTTPLVNFTPSGATYNTTSGDLVLQLNANHGLTAGTSIKLAQDSLTFECPAAVGTHTFVSGTAGGITPNAGSAVTAAAGTTYNPTTGDMVIEIGSHSLTTSNTVAIANGAVTFTCDADNHGTNHSYPRATDPVSGNNAIPITAVGATTITVNVGVASSNSQSTYPRATGAATGSGADYAYNTALLITNADQAAGTITVNVNGGQGAISVGSAHTFVSATSGAIISGGNYAHTFVSGAANGVKFTPQTAHTFVTAATNAISHTPQSPHAFVRANTDAVSAYSSSAGSICATVESSVNTSLELFADIVDGTTLPGATTQTFGSLYNTIDIETYPDSYIYDTANNRTAIRGSYDDYPIIEASPYTQNSSVISFRGGGGALVDGSKVKQPNCPFPGLEPDGTASYPNQGKSMVASAFTIVSFGGIGYRIIEDGYVQLVSVFVIFCQDGVLAESGGYASITNSATNFGTYALRGIGFRDEAYSFDVGTVNVVSQTPTGRTTLTIGSIGREPLEHYIVKLDGYRNADPTKEFFIDSVSGVTVGPPFSATLVLDDGVGNGLTLIEEATGNTIAGLAALQQALTPSGSSNATIKLHRPSIVNSSSHTWEFAGSGNNYLALPENGGTKVEANEQVSQDYGRVYVSGTDELGDFKVGTFARIENRTGNITFTGTVTISEVEFLKLKGGDVVVTGFDNSNTLGGANASDSKLPTQKAVKDYITNSLGPYINKPYSTNAVPRALVELTDSGKISLDQIPALRPFSVYTVADQAARLALEGALAGDIAIQQDTQTSFILNNDLTSLYLGFAVDSNLSFTIGNVFTGTPSTGRIQSTEYRQGVLYKINISDGGSGYTVAPTVTISGGNQSGGAVVATATCSIANGEVVTITINENAGYIGGFGYTTQPTITIAAPPGAGTQATATALIESRLYGNIVNNIKMLDTDTFDDSSSPSANTINITRVVNTSAFTAGNWVSLSSDSVGVSSLTGPGLISTTLLGSEAANSFSFLRGDQSYAKVVQSLKGAETRYFARLYAQASTGASSFIFQGLSDVLKGHDIVANVGGIAADTTVNGVSVSGGLTTVSFNNPITANIALGTVIEFNRGASPLIFDSTNTGGDFIDSVVIANPGTGYTDGQYFDVALDAPAGNNGVDLKANIIVGENGQTGQITTCTVTNAGNGYTQDFQVTPLPTAIGAGSNGVLLAKISTTQKQFANIALDVQRVSDLTISQDLYGTIGVARFKKSQFNIGDEGNGAVSIKMGPDSGLDADLLDGQQGGYYLNGAFFVDNSIVPDKLASGVYSIDISGRSTNTLRLDTGTSNANANPGPSDAVQGVTLQTLFNSSNGLLSAYPSVDTGNSNSAKHLVMTLRNGETGGDATFGGVRQLAFANDDRIYFRGSGDAVTSYGSWYEVWNSGNQGVDSGLDADKLDNKQGVWYQDAWNIKTNTIFDTRLPTWRSSTKFRDKIEVSSYGGTDTFYRILVRQNLDISVGGDFEVTNTIDLFDVNKISVGDFTITATQQNVDQNDSSNTYTMLIGRLASGGNIDNAIYLGVAGDERIFEHWEIYDANTVQYAELGNNAGTGFLRLGRNDGNNASNPYIYFNSSQTAATYNAAIIADGGNGTTGSGSLEFKVLDENELKVNNNIIWNAGNVAFNDTNVASTAALKSAVMRDTSGNFAAGTITANLTGAASLNVLKSGDTMTGSLTLTGGSGINIQSTGTLAVGASTTIGTDLTVDSGTFYVNSTDNVVNVGQTNNSNNATFNVYDNNGGAEFNTALAISSQRSLYQSSVFNQNDAGEGGLILQHGASAAAQWGISTHRTGSSVGELIFRTRTAGSSSATRLVISNGGNVLAGADSDQDLGADGTRWQNIYSDITHALNSVRIAKGTANQEADIQLRGGGTGAGGGRGFRLGTNIGGGADLFEIYSSQNNGDDDWKSLASGAPALAIQGTNNRVGINTNSFSGTDTSTTPNTNRDYILNVQGDMNLNGQFFQNNEEFVTSRWTESTNDSGANIYRNSKVGIGNVSAPAYQLDVGGDFNLTGVMYVGGAAQWFDSYGIIKGGNDTISESVTIPNNVSAQSNGPITIAAGGGHVVTIGTGATWSII